MKSPGRLAALRLASVLLVLGATSGSAAAAASPSPTAAPAGAGPVGNIQAYLDADFIVPDAPPGGVLEAGFSFWDPRERDFLGIDGIYVKLHPATGDAPPSEGTIRSDFPGHVIADLVVPNGGPGTVEVGTHGLTCTDPGGCVDDELPFTIAGVGPPLGASPEKLIGAEILPLVGDTVVGREFPVAVNVLPRGLWDFSALPLPDHLVVIARHHGGPELSTGELGPPATPGTPFTGQLVIPETGDVEITVAVPLQDGSTREIEGSTITRSVVDGGRRESPGASGPAAPAPSADSQAAAQEGIPSMVWIVGLGALVVVVGLVLRRVLADL